MVDESAPATTPEPNGLAEERQSLRAYDAFLSLRPGGDPLGLVTEQLVVWLGEKGIAADLAGSMSIPHARGDLAVVHHASGHGHDMLTRLTESTPTGTWRTQILVHGSESDSGWIRIRVTNDQGRFVDVPRVATYVMDVLDTYDGPAMFTSEPRVFRADQGDELLDIVCDPDRRAPVFVAGSDQDLPFDAYVKRVHEWTKQVRGMGHVIVLDPLATREFQEMVGDAHATASGTIRTYLPELDPATAIDARRHKILGTRRLVDQSDRDTRMLLGRIARGLASERSLPPSVSRVERALRRMEDTYLVETITAPVVERPVEAAAQVERVALAEAVVEGDSAATLAERAEVYLAQIELTRVILGVDALDEATLRDLAAAADRGRVTALAVERVTQQLRQHEEREAELEDAVQFHREWNDELELDLAISEADQSALADENRWLRERLREARDFEGATVMLPESATIQYPRSFDELLARVGEFAPFGVIYCGDKKTTLDLDALDRLERLVRAAWDGFLTVADFLKARGRGACTAGLTAYVDNTPAGYRGVTNKRFSAGETGATMKQFGDERMLPVPLDVSSDGRALMKTHFKLGRVGMASPRMYVLDRSGVDGKVYVGYIGTHMTNTQTN